MRSYSIVVLGIALAGSIGLYGVRAYARQNAIAGPIQDGAVGVRTRTTTQADPAPLVNREEKIVASLRLSQGQMTRYQALARELKSRNAALYAMSSGHIARGQEINAWWRASLQKVFTPRQYQQYLEAWNRPILTSDQVMASGTPFGGMEERILAQLGLSASQKTRIAAHLKRMDAYNKDLYALFRTGTGEEIAQKSSQGNRLYKQGMQEIMTPAQYEAWIRAWDDVMRPFMGHGDPGVRARIVGADEKASNTVFSPIRARNPQDPR